MPKKTKREKIMAEYRRKMRLLEPVPKEKAEIKKTPEKDKEEQVGLKYFYQDLRKSVFLISLIILLEVFLYFVKM